MWDDVAKALGAGRRFVLTTHVSSDGDGIGSELALGRVLRGLGKDVSILNPTPTHSRYAFLFEPGEVEMFTPEHEETVAAADAIVILDINRWERLGIMAEPIRRARGRKICIDHHPAPDHFGDLDVSDPAVSATGVLVHDLILTLVPDLPPETVDPIYVAIMTDTGSFRFANTTSRVLAMGADLINRGARPDHLYRCVYETSSTGRMRLLGNVLSDLAYDEGGALVHFTVTQAMMRACGVGIEETDGFTDIVRGVAGSRVVVAFVESDDGGSKVSLRSKGDRLDVSRIARSFGGGGHHNASGIADERPLATLKPEVLAVVRDLLQRTPEA